LIRFLASACWTLVLFEKYWEIIADNLSKAGWTWAAHPRLIQVAG
jgi:hypothetical protein